MAAPPLIELLARGVVPQDWGGGGVLVPGCGLGHDVRELAARIPGVLGLDVSPVALDRARAIPCSGSETYLLANLFDRSWRPPGGFTGWWEHTCFCAIHPSMRPAYATAAAELVRPGGWLAGVFYLTPNDPGEEDKGPPFNATTAEIEGLLAPWFRKVDAWVPGVSYPGREGREWTAVFRRTDAPAGF